jgi:hypothetical protein
MDLQEKLDWDTDPDILAPCPTCGWTKTNKCLSCHQLVWPLHEGEEVTLCCHCHADVRRIPFRADRGAEEFERRLSLAVKCLDELVILVMGRIAVVSRIDAEDLIEASGMANAAGDEDDRQASEPPPNLKPCTNLASYNGSGAAPKKT